MGPLTEGKCLLVGLAPLNEGVHRLVELPKAIILITGVIGREPVNTSI